jgi:hypothetical protein
VVSAAERQGTADRRRRICCTRPTISPTPSRSATGTTSAKDALRKLLELGRKVEELLGKGKIRPPATTQIRQAIAELAQAVQDAG